VRSRAVKRGVSNHVAPVFEQAGRAHNVGRIPVC
jgi:hypothetical protein